MRRGRRVSRPAPSPAISYLGVVAELGVSALVVLGLLFAALGPGILGERGTLVYNYDVGDAAARVRVDGFVSEASDQHGCSRRVSPLESACAYDDALTPARASALPGAYRSAPQTAGARFVAGSDGVITDLVGRTPNAISIGRFPAYVDDAAASGARAFNVGDDWAAMAARKDRFGGVGEGSEIWIRNTRFLDQAIARRSQIRLASDPFDPLNEGSFFLREVEYLRTKGAL